MKARTFILLGVMLYELVVGQVPFNSDTPFSIVHDHIYTPLPLPRVRNDDVPEAVERVLLKALAKSRPDRYESVDVLVERFLAAFDGQVDPDLPFLDPVSAVLSPLDVGSSTAEEAQSAAASRASAAHSEARPSSTEAVPTPAKTRRRWLWIAIPAGLVLCACAFIGFLILTSEPEPNSGADPTAVVPDSSTPPAVDTAPTEVLSDVPESEASAIDRAIVHVEANPDDPYAHLALAQAYWEAGRVDEAAAAIEAVFELGSEDPDFYVQLGDYFYDRELWFEAVETYLVAAGLNGNVVPSPVRPRLERAIYNAAIDDRVEDGTLLGRDSKIRGIEPTLLMVARSRRLFYGDQPQAAREQLLLVFEDQPDYAPGLLLEAELLIASGETEAGRTLLERLVAGDITPNWVSIQARAFLFQLDQ